MNTSNTNDYSVFKDALGKRIQLLRTAASLTQEALAANSGLTRTTIVDIEKGATNPTLERTKVPTSCSPPAETSIHPWWSN